MGNNNASARKNENSLFMMIGMSWAPERNNFERYKNKLIREYCRRLGILCEVRSFKVQNLKERFHIFMANRETLRKWESKFVEISEGVILLYDATSISKFVELPKLIKKIKELNPKIIILITGVYCDPQKQKKVSTEAGKKCARSELVEFFELHTRNKEDAKRMLEQAYQELASKIVPKERLIPPDPIEVEGKSLESKDTNELPTTSVTEKEFENGSLTETEIMNYKSKDTNWLEYNNPQTEAGGENLLMKKDDTSTSKVKDSELKENGYPSGDESVPKEEKSAISEEERLYEGKCPVWFT